jgi:hypothetical protein
MNGRSVHAALPIASASESGTDAAAYSAADAPSVAAKTGRRAGFDRVKAVPIVPAQRRVGSYALRLQARLELRIAFTRHIRIIDRRRDVAEASRYTRLLAARDRAAPARCRRVPAPRRRRRERPVAFRPAHFAGRTIRAGGLPCRATSAAGNGRTVAEYESLRPRQA